MAARRGLRRSAICLKEVIRRPRQRRCVGQGWMNTGLCLSSIKSGHICDAVCRGLGSKKTRPALLTVRDRASPYPRSGACASHYSNSYTTAERGADSVRRRPRHDQCIPSGLNRSTVLRRRFAKVSGKPSHGLECRSTEPGGQRSRHKLDRGP